MLSAVLNQAFRKGRVHQLHDHSISPAHLTTTLQHSLESRQFATLNIICF